MSKAIRQEFLSRFPELKGREIAKNRHETDINTILLRLWSPTGAGEGTPGYLLDPTDSIVASLYIGNRVDDSRDIVFTFVWYEANELVVDGELSLWEDPCDGISATITLENAINHDITFTNANTYIESSYVLAASDVENDTLYTIGWVNADIAGQIWINAIQVEYYVKRLV